MTVAPSLKFSCFGVASRVEKRQSTIGADAPKMIAADSVHRCRQRFEHRRSIIIGAAAREFLASSGIRLVLNTMCT
jgi:hypothetical protein